MELCWKVAQREPHTLTLTLQRRGSHGKMERVPRAAPFCDSQAWKVPHTMWDSEPNYPRTALQGSRA